jgi:hypothetical protein
VLKRLAIFGVLLIVLGSNGRADQVQTAKSSQQPAAPILRVTPQQTNAAHLQGKDQEDIRADVKIVNPPEKDFYDKAPVWINLALLILGAGGVVAAICTLRAINKQAEIAANSQRSWIIPKGASKPDLSGNWILSVSCEFDVFGLSPVRVFESKIRLHFVAAKPSDGFSQAIPDLPGIPVYGTPTTLDDSPEMGRIWAPGATIVVKPMLEHAIAEKDQLQSLRDGKNVLCLYGYIRYRDAFDKSKMRETHFCFTCGQMGPLDAKLEEHFVLGGPPAYNEID